MLHFASVWNSRKSHYFIVDIYPDDTMYLLFTCDILQLFSNSVTVLFYKNKMTKLAFGTLATEEVNGFYKYQFL